MSFKIFGTARKRLIDYGELVTDRRGLQTCTVTWEMATPDLQGAIAANMPRKGEVHPLYSWMTLETYRVIPTLKGMVVFKGDFVGAFELEDGDESDPTYELVAGVTEEAIELHPKFVERIGGRPSAPLNGAVFVDAEGNEFSELYPKADDFARFSHFLLWHSAKQNRFAGLEAYLDLGHVEWVKSWVQKSIPKDSLNEGGRLDEPGNPCPEVADDRTWLNMGIDVSGRGKLWTCRQRWRLSNRGGHLTEVYAKNED